MKRFKTISAGMILLMLLANCAKPGKEPGPFLSAGNEIRAVSLKRLQENLKACAPTSSCPQELLQLAGVRRLAGVMVDPVQSDLILYGTMDRDLPPLHLDDFVVALKNAWLKYAVLKGNVREYAYPGCSIDPRPENVRNLQLIGQQMGTETSPANKEKHIVAWERECEAPQTVRVLGIPFNTHFAQVMVKADYDLKRLADGSDVVDVPGFVSISDMITHEASTALSQQKPIALPGSMLNRFWLYPGDNSYEEDDEAIFIKRCPVTLQTELMHSNSKGAVSGSGTAEPEASRFANDFTLLYDKIAQDKTIYQELDGLFRFVAIAGIIKQKAESNLAFDLSYLLDGYQVADTPVENSLAGRHSVKEFRQTWGNAQSYSEVRFWLPSCGGVDITIDESKRHTSRDNAGFLASLKAGVLKSKPSPDSFYWDYSKEPDLLSEFELNAGLFDSNQVSKNILVVGVVHKPDGYRVYDGQSEPLYAGDDLTELVRIVKAKASSDNKAVQAFFKDFPDLKSVQSFLSTYETQSERFNLIKNPLADTAADFIEQRNLFLMPGVQVDKAGSYVEPISEGAYQGKFKLVLNFVAKTGRAIKGVTIHVITQSRAAAEAFLSGVLSRFHGPNSSSTRTLADIIEETHQELKQRFSTHEIIRIYVDQYGAKPQSKLVIVGAETAS